MADSAVFSAKEILDATSACAANGVPLSGSFSIATDSRRDCSNALFIAIRGETFDPHDFLDRAVAAGAAALLIESGAAGRIDPAWRIPVLVVENTLHAYWSLARLHRLRFPELKVAALTGSVGKTSVKEMIRAICTAACGNADAVLYTVGNTNNHFGVPANLLRLESRHRFAVIEIGTSGPGEIEPLAGLVCPDVAAVNTIAACHLERLGSLRGVAREKAMIFSALRPGGTAVFPAVCEGVDVLDAAAPAHNRLRFGEGGDVTGRYLGGNLHGGRVELNWKNGPTLAFDWSLAGAHQAANAACAAAVGTALGFDPETIVRGLISASLPGMRMNVKRFRDADWILDAYNANPASMKAALAWLGDFADPCKLLLVLGDMLELGIEEQREHFLVLADVLERFPHAQTVLVGPRMAHAAGLLPPTLQENWHSFPDSVAAAETVVRLAEPGFTVLLKGSRGIAVEKAAPGELLG
ncbi:MAG: UDP-N-acetylmuramoyl-tripeptide--D-alanyl-D-alanine ligase [Victivallaceae bacterium]|nr:UDP-N-acetylmuramoyl-tripeptide--D-alanyl-D-alanine ligase [Victivallaceae bacterium]